MTLFPYTTLFRSPVASLTERLRQRNSHRNTGGPDARKDVSGIPPMPNTEPPTVFTFTITDLAVDGTFPAEGYADRVRLWAAETVRVWEG